MPKEPKQPSLPNIENKPLTTQPVCLRLTPRETGKVDAAAAAHGMDRSAWLRMTVLDALAIGGRL